MKIEGNQKELDAMVEFHKGKRVEGLRLQEEFAAEFRKEYKDKDHCPCLLYTSPDSNLPGTISSIWSSLTGIVHILLPL